MFVQVVEYDPKWPDLFLTLKEKLLKHVPDHCRIEHVGSTSVPGLSAKPIIDIDIICAKEEIPAVIETLTDEYNSMGEWKITGRFALREKTVTIPHNLYVCEDGCWALRNHLILRDTCRRDPAVRDAYGNKKMELSKQEWESSEEYSIAKTDIIKWVLEQGGLVWARD